MKPILYLLLILGICPSPAVMAGDLMVSRAVLEDPAGILTINEVVKREFQPTGSTFFGGFTDSVYWFRLKLRMPEQGGNVFLRVYPGILDEVRLYEPTGAGAWNSRATGDRQDLEARNHAGSALGFIVEAKSLEMTYYLRLKTTGSSVLSVDALTSNEALTKNRQINLAQSVFVGLMLWPLFWSLQNYLVNKQAVDGLFACYQAICIFLELALSGNIATFLPPLLADATGNLLFCASPFFMLLLTKALFKPYQPPPLLMDILNLALLVLALELLAASLGYSHWALVANTALLTVCRWYYVLVAFTLRQESLPSRRMVQTVYTALALLTSVVLIVHQGWGILPKPTMEYPYLLLVYALINSALLVILLNARLRQRRAEAQRHELDLALSRQTLDMERSLKEKAETQARTDYLTGLFNRRHFMELAERELDRCKRNGRNLTLLMIDVDHFKSVNDNWGHAAGDQALIQVSHRLRDSLREVDVIGRMGGRGVCCRSGRDGRPGGDGTGPTPARSDSQREIFPPGLRAGKNHRVGWPDGTAGSGDQPRQPAKRSRRGLVRRQALGPQQREVYKA